ncbi:MAG: nucleotide sugar dehydrogenase [Candidatus Glassbacteria bacterium]
MAKPKRNTLEAGIVERRALVSVIGLGYVGLPLALTYIKAGFNVLGLEVDKQKLALLSRGESGIVDVENEELAKCLEKDELRITDDFSRLSESDIMAICVPTPLDKTKSPDVSYLLDATKQIKKYLQRGQLVILESTTYPGTTQELICPILEETGLTVGDDFFLAYSPERVDPGNRKFSIANTPKVLGGITDRCLYYAKLFYEQVVDSVIPVSSAKSAEMVKLLENTFRSVNIALVNEVALMCNVLGIDVWEVIDAAATKPFGYMRFYPGPGLGGHCIPIDPHYLSWKLKSLNYYARFIELAGEINSNMPRFVMGKVMKGLNEDGKSVKGSGVLVLGVAYKANINDVRESPALDIIRLLQESGADVLYHDPFVPSLMLDGEEFNSTPLTGELLQKLDCLVITTDHSDLDYGWIASHSKLIVDSRNATKNLGQTKARIVRL